jgi:hypothetical protein
MEININDVVSNIKYIDGNRLNSLLVIDAVITNNVILLKDILDKNIEFTFDYDDQKNMIKSLSYQH